MRHFRKLSIVYLSLIFSLIFLFAGVSRVLASDSDGKPDEPRILFISSYSYGWDTVQIQIEGVKAGLSDDAMIDYEFMDTKRFPDEASIQMFYEGLKYRMSKVPPYSAVIVGDDAALHFAVDHKDDIFKDTPIIFEGVNDVAFAVESSKDPMITGIIEKLSFQKNIDFALKLYPDATQVIAVLDDTLTGQVERAAFYNNRQLYPDLKFDEINTSALTTEELKAAFKNLDRKHTILIYIVMTEDASGVNYTSKQAISLVAQYSPVAALRMVSGGIGEGLLGGNIVSMYSSGKIVAEVACEIAHGTNPADYSAILESPNSYIIDESVMRKYNLNLNLIPKDAEVINHLPTFSEKYGEVLIPFIIIVCLLLIIIIMVLRKNLQQGERAKKLETVTKQLERSTASDFLTGLNNRSKLYSDLDNLQKMNSICTLFMFDIDGFKQINDTYGHGVGDEVLVELSKRLQTLSDSKFTPYRMAGDEFACILKSNVEYEINAMARKCMTLFDDEFKISKGKGTLPVHISLGIAVCPNDCNNTLKLLEYADKAMYSVKQSGKNDYAWYKDIA